MEGGRWHSSAVPRRKFRPRFPYKLNVASCSRIRHTPSLTTMLYSSLASAALLVASVSAHATFQELWVNGVDQGDYCARLPQSNNPVTSVTSNVSNDEG